MPTMVLEVVIQDVLHILYVVEVNLSLLTATIERNVEAFVVGMMKMLE